MPSDINPHWDPVRNLTFIYPLFLSRSPLISLLPYSLLISPVPSFFLVPWSSFITQPLGRKASWDWLSHSLHCILPSSSDSAPSCLPPCTLGTSVKIQQVGLCLACTECQLTFKSPLKGPFSMKYPVATIKYELPLFELPYLFVFCRTYQYLSCIEGARDYDSLLY